MVNTVKIKIKYCGGCNPQIKRVEVVKEVLKLLRKEYLVEVVNENKEADVCLLVCGCDSLCLDREEYKAGCKQYVLIGGKLVDYMVVSEDVLPAIIVKEVKKKID